SAYPAPATASARSSVHPSSSTFSNNQYTARAALSSKPATGPAGAADAAVRDAVLNEPSLTALGAAAAAKGERASAVPAARAASLPLTRRRVSCGNIVTFPKRGSDLTRKD